MSGVDALFLASAAEAITFLKYLSLCRQQTYSALPFSKCSLFFLFYASTGSGLHSSASMMLVFTNTLCTTSYLAFRETSCFFVAKVTFELLLNPQIRPLNRNPRLNPNPLGHWTARSPDSFPSHSPRSPKECTFHWQSGARS